EALQIRSLGFFAAFPLAADVAASGFVDAEIAVAGRQVRRCIARLVDAVAYIWVSRRYPTLLHAEAGRVNNSTGVGNPGVGFCARDMRVDVVARQLPRPTARIFRSGLFDEQRIFPPHPL